MTLSITRLVAPLLVALLLLANAVPAFAHAQLLSTRPEANAILDQAPETLSLAFNEPVSPLVITLVAPDGAVTDLTAASTSGKTLAVHLPSGLGVGTHVLSWRVVSVDAHPVAGALVFSLGRATGTAPPETTGSRTTAMLLWASKLMLFAGLFLGLGGAVFALAAPLSRPAQRPVAALALLGLVAAPLSLGLHGADALGLPPDALLSAPAWVTGFATSYGLTALLVAMACTLALLGLMVLPALAWSAWLMAAIALAISGHAGAAAPQWLTRPVVALHIGGILFWIGALIPLWHWLRERSAAADRALVRFSRFVPYAVAAILVSGGTLALVQLGPPGSAWLTPYGYILAAKLGLLFILFLLALWNRFRLTAPVLAGELTPRLHLRRSILAELVLVLAILALAAGWRFTPPPRAIAAAAAAQAALALPAYAHAMNDAVMADIVVTPGRAGPVTIDMSIVDGAGAPLQPVGVNLTLSAPAMGIEPIKLPATPVDGIWRVEGQAIPLPGTWEMVLDIRIDRFTLARIGTDITLP
ncbi:CopD family protein [Devosia salina]|uniref:Copper resistance protein CopC/CopD n=1 Tax=Devosia salina TaxID=2860336 RepID=A0ABX8WE08_9HYPH|nr:copper resistance protein CopC [Devosia salina]QYO77123.1 copper resistance protein CopC/CopD [Devosia salina]